MPFSFPNKKECIILFSNLYKKYWEIGFKSHLYDWLSPEAYHESLRQAVESVKLGNKGLILDAGCGSGLLLSLLADWLPQRGRYLGLDILPPGLASLRLKASRLNLDNFVSGIRAEISQNLPFKDQSVSCVVAHFSIYTLPEDNDRSQAYREFWRVLKPGGLLITANPTCSYDANQIIRSSLEQLQSRRKSWVIKKLMIYPLTLHLGLRHIERQLKSGRWHGYQPEELCDEIVRAGFSIERSKTVYGGSGFLVVGRKS